MFPKAEDNVLKRIQKAHEAESLLSQATDKYTDLINKEGYSLRCTETEPAEYISGALFITSARRRGILSSPLSRKAHATSSSTETISLSKGVFLKVPDPFVSLDAALSLQSLCMEKTATNPSVDISGQTR